MLIYGIEKTITKRKKIFFNLPDSLIKFWTAEKNILAVCIIRQIFTTQKLIKGFPKPYQKVNQIDYFLHLNNFCIQ